MNHNLLGSKSGRARLLGRTGNSQSEDEIVIDLDSSDSSSEDSVDLSTHIQLVAHEPFIDESIHHLEEAPEVDLEVDLQVKNSLLLSGTWADIPPDPPIDSLSSMSTGKTIAKKGEKGKGKWEHDRFDGSDSSQEKTGKTKSFKKKKALTGGMCRSDRQGKNDSRERDSFRDDASRDTSSKGSRDASRDVSKDSRDACAKNSRERPAKDSFRDASSKTKSSSPSSRDTSYNVRDLKVTLRQNQNQLKFSTDGDFNQSKFSSDSRTSANDADMDSITAPLKSISLSRINSEKSTHSVRNQSPLHSSGELFGEHVNPLELKPEAKRPSISQKAKDVLIASMDRKLRTTLPPPHIHSHIRRTPSPQKNAVDAPEFIPSHYDPSTSFHQFDTTKQMVVAQTIMAANGQCYIVTDTGLMIHAPEYTYQQPQYFPQLNQTGMTYPQGYQFFPQQFGFDEQNDQNSNSSEQRIISGNNQDFPKNQKQNKQNGQNKNQMKNHNSQTGKNQRNNYNDQNNGLYTNNGQQNQQRDRHQGNNNGPWQNQNDRHQYNNSQNQSQQSGRHSSNTNSGQSQNDRQQSQNQQGGWFQSNTTSGQSQNQQNDRFQSNTNSGQSQSQQNDRHSANDNGQTLNLGERTSSGTSGKWTGHGGGGHKVKSKPYNSGVQKMGGRGPKT